MGQTSTQLTSPSDLQQCSTLLVAVAVPYVQCLICRMAMAKRPVNESTGAVGSLLLYIEVVTFMAWRSAVESQDGGNGPPAHGNVI
eukprot:CAMPEP_0174369154 /NCGR_PEP_ID=MMETSP0811_2-20130205/91484_1 /TAXON_ID=73025 ORGANISM="Eutreptiella gymnastica-like, Strain CCMP1594" /NCGR_SAMPLE_ID=MMETSP0811_2 /ASSEMBLY_ACC=CAM_ASM_000667 /LENGTH=85 /DNA_ID=CAMNT_0015513303 /DNA_START=211 /DNA_END=466 /DNA_ORIENTATION=+